MKNLFSMKSLAMAFIACSMMLAFTSCEKDETPARDKFIGSFKLNEVCPSGPVVDFNVTITASSSAENKILINGFGGFAVAGNNIVVEATVDGDDLTLVSNQSFGGGDIVINSGSGSISANGNNITVSYSYTSGGASETCNGTYTKQ